MTHPSYTPPFSPVNGDGDNWAFTYVGPSVTAAHTTGVFNEQLRQAQIMLNRQDLQTHDALNLIPNAPQISEVDIASEIDMPVAPVIEGMTSAELTALYQGTADEIEALLGAGLTTFYTSYFPLGNELVAARAWVENAILNGGTGIPAAVEDQIWQRDRARLLRDSARATDEAVSRWASRGYPVPPGALVEQVSLIEQDARDKIAQASRDVAIKQAEIEIENVKFAITTAITMRTAAVQAAGDYIRTLALGPELGVKLATAQVEARTAMAQALTSFYQAEVSALELPIRIAIADANADVDVRKANLGATVDIIKARVALVDAAAQSAGSAAAAAMNALRGSSDINGREDI